MPARTWRSRWATGRRPSPSPGINYDRCWLLWRGRIIHEGFELISGLGEIVLVESFKRPEKKEE